MAQASNATYPDPTGVKWVFEGRNSTGKRLFGNSLSFNETLSNNPKNKTLPILDDNSLLKAKKKILLSTSKVINALNNPEWDFRTIQGLSKELNLEASEVQKILENNLHLVREALVPDSKGRILYTARNRPKKLKEYCAFAWVLITRTFK
ncbi:hypothetical protein [Acaryochloris sp. CCMEE 5410]|uniref:hypothetical protein n=1 Tax=Acaryochloris sp. CCMEE 5410 TaxID=310037 RepID=UPI0002483E31|nr:hypothetical protein [Acaryochloris sp. CCMEE 5410]KAI9134349.1 hypothetical protein ON05_014380 [Acaryochloris sp. CCMEE 5410]